MVTVALPSAAMPQEDYYATHPLQELPPEEEPKEEPVEEPPAQPVFSGIRMCRSVNKYKKLARLNEGSYGIVYKAQNLETGEIVALKRVVVVFFLHA